MFFNVPGLRNSDEHHWQTIWENKYPDRFIRIIQDDWERPERNAWVSRIEQVTSSFPHDEIVLIGHSVGCAAIVHWGKEYKRKIKAALLVAPSDVDRQDYPTYITGFNPMPLWKLPFPTLVIASSNDHVVTVDRARYFADHWESEFKLIDNAGHIEDKSGYGEWNEGMRMLRSFINRSGPNPQTSDKI